jgi:hypothetical protein
MSRENILKRGKEKEKNWTGDSGIYYEKQKLYCD